MCVSVRNLFYTIWKLSLESPQSSDSLHRFEKTVLPCGGPDLYLSKIYDTEEGTSTKCALFILVMLDCMFFLFGARQNLPWIYCQAKQMDFAAYCDQLCPPNNEPDTELTSGNLWLSCEAELFMAVWIWASWCAARQAELRNWLFRTSLSATFHARLASRCRVLWLHRAGYCPDDDRVGMCRGVRSLARGVFVTCCSRA